MHRLHKSSPMASFLIVFQAQKLGQRDEAEHHDLAPHNALTSLQG